MTLTTEDTDALSLDLIDHVAIVVHDLEQAINWYTSSFVCSVLVVERQQALLQFANLKLQLVLPSLQQNHIGYRRDDAASLGQLRPTIDHQHSTFIADPTGNIVELVTSVAADQEDSS